MVRSYLSTYRKFPWGGQWFFLKIMHINLGPRYLGTIPKSNPSFSIFSWRKRGGVVGVQYNYIKAWSPPGFPQLDPCSPQMAYPPTKGSGPSIYFRLLWGPQIVTRYTSFSPNWEVVHGWVWPLFWLKKPVDSFPCSIYVSLGPWPFDL